MSAWNACKKFITMDERARRRVGRAWRECDGGIGKSTTIKCRRPALTEPYSIHTYERVHKTIKDDFLRGQFPLCA